jgi:hypothetical protein
MLEITQLRLSRMAFDRGGVKGLAARLGMNHALLSAVERAEAKCPERWRPLLSEAVKVPVELLFNDRGMALPASKIPKGK